MGYSRSPLRIEQLGVPSKKQSLLAKTFRLSRLSMALLGNGLSSKVFGFVRVLGTPEARALNLKEVEGTSGHLDMPRPFWLPWPGVYMSNECSGGELSFLFEK